MSYLDDFADGLAHMAKQTKWFTEAERDSMLLAITKVGVLLSGENTEAPVEVPPLEPTEDIATETTDDSEPVVAAYSGEVEVHAPLTPAQRPADETIAALEAQLEALKATSGDDSSTD